MTYKKNVLDDFIWGMTILNSYIKFNNINNWYDINIVSEDFFCNLLNTIWQYKLINDNDFTRNSSGYDLISESDKTIIQVSSSCTSDKIKSAFKTLKNRIAKYDKMLKEYNNLCNLNILKSADLERKQQLEYDIKRNKNLKGYTIKFLFLTENADALKKYRGKDKVGFIQPNGLKFNSQKDIVSFKDLISYVNHLPEDSEEIQKLVAFMKRNSSIFSKRDDTLICKSNNVNRIIDEYALNYESKLFRHTYIQNSNVTLKNIYVSPSFHSYTDINNSSRNFVAEIDDFLWQKEDNDIYRIMFIDGDAAVGKTSLISWLCYYYKNIESEEIGRTIFLDRKLVCVRLRELDFSKKYNKAEEYILDYLSINDLEEFYADYKEAVIVLDGADELSMVEGIPSKTIENFFLDLRTAFKNNKFIITSRPKFLDMQKFRDLSFKIKWIYIEHFDEDLRREWIDNYLACGETIPESTQQYILNLSDTAADGVADTPLALYLLSCCEMREELQGNNWALYHEIFKNAITKTEYNENFNSNISHPINNNVDTIYGIVGSIANVMFKNSKEERYFITGNELEKIIAKLEIIETKSVELIKHSCVLCAYWKQNDPKTGALEFYHNDIRDFFLCEHIYYTLLSSCIDLKENKITLGIFIEHLCHLFSYGSLLGTTWEQVYCFIYYRLIYERSHLSHHNITIFNLLDIQNFYPKLIKQMFSNDGLWKCSYDDIPYISAKYVLFNTLMILRVWFEAICDNKEIQLKMWQDSTEQNRIYNSNIFSDWCKMFTYRIKLSSDHHISIGSRIFLPNINLEHCKINNSDFSYSNLENANFKDTSLSCSSFRNAHLKGAIFTNANLRGADFTGADLTGANFDGAILTEAKFINANLSHTSWEHVNFDSVSFENSRISNVNWKRKSFKNSILSGATILKSTLSNDKFTNTAFNNTEFISVEICNAALNSCSYNNTKILENTKFENCYAANSEFNNLTVCSSSLKDSRFGNSRFYDLHIESSILTGVAFSECSINNANFTNNEAYNIDFRNAKFSKVKFKDTVFRSIQINGAFIVDNAGNKRPLTNKDFE